MSQEDGGHQLHVKCWVFGNGSAETTNEDRASTMAMTALEFD